MSITLVTGGARSGKSSFAEGLLKDYDDVLYIATAIALDKEMEERIARHKESRNQKWRTHEGFKNLWEVVRDSKEEYMFLDCVTIMTTNLLFEEERDWDNLGREEIEKLTEDIKVQFTKLIECSRKNNKTLVMVTNEVGWGLVPEYKLSRIFRDIAGFVNQHIATLCDEVYLVACGLPVKLKG